MKLEYNAIGLLIREYQEHAGAVNTSTSPQVGYAYADGASNHARRTGITYPNSRIVRYEYSPGADNVLCRPSFLADDSDGSIGTHLAEYTYLGLNGITRVDYPESCLRYDLATGTDADPHTGLDRFDRVVDLLWRDYAHGQDAVRIQHGYDAAGNRLWREYTVAPAGHDELYGYDRLNQLVDFNRGDLSTTKTSVTSLTLHGQWQLDATGNWTRFEQIDLSDATQTFDQTRTHGVANELTGLAHLVGSAWAASQHDRAGNMTQLPQPSSPTSAFTCVYDAWNRLVRVSVATTSQTVAQYVYDGRNYRVVKKTYTAGQLTETRHAYYSDQWQVLEERVGTSTSANRQFVWGLRYIDDMVLRDRSTSSAGTLNERLYALQDANWNVAAIATAAGTLAEHYLYTAYGRCTPLDTSFAPLTSSAYAWEHLFTGRLHDAETGLMHYRARYYHTGLGRFITRDPLGYEGGDANLFRYCDNSPTILVDPRGTGFFSWLGEWWEYSWPHAAEGAAEVAGVKAPIGTAIEALELAPDLANLAIATRIRELYMDTLANPSKYTQAEQDRINALVHKLQQHNSCPGH